MNRILMTATHEIFQAQDILANCPGKTQLGENPFEKEFLFFFSAKSQQNEYTVISTYLNPEDQNLCLENCAEDAMLSVHRLS